MTDTEASTQYTFSNPVTRYPAIVPPIQGQIRPGSEAALQPHADHGEASYVGSRRLCQRKALITGGDSGIGAAVAIAFAREGADVALIHLPEERRDARAVATYIAEAGAKSLLIEGDITDKEFCRSAVERTVTELGGLDILVNNAGTQFVHPDVAETSDEEFDRTVKTNIYGTHWITKAAVPYLPAGATIINTTSVQAYDPSSGLADYAATKAWVNVYTKALAGQLAPKGIRVNAVAPGPVWTPLQPASSPGSEKLRHFGDQTWLGRAAQPAELAPAYVFLASPESSYVVGATIAVTGGMPTP